MKPILCAAIACLVPSLGDAQCTLQKVLPSATSAGDSVNRGSLSNGRLLVGAWKADNAGTDSGAAYVFTEGGASWVQQAELVPSQLGASDWFGKEVALDGDVAVVGAPQAFSPGDPPGRAHVFRWDGASWNEEAVLTASDAHPDMRFGAGVDVDGDVIIVGAYKALTYGKAYIFERMASQWVEVADLSSPDPADPHSFSSHSVAVHGDLAVVGARYDHELGNRAGAAFVFRRSAPGTWMQEQKLLASDGEAGDVFGYAGLGVDGSRIIVPARHADSFRGAAYVFEHDGSLWVETARLVGSDAVDGDEFGTHTSINGDRALVGAKYADPLGGGSGAAYLFEYNGGSWQEQEKLVAPDGAAGDAFGVHVNLDDEYVAVTAFLDDNTAGVDAGSVYVRPLTGSVLAAFSSSRPWGAVPHTVRFWDQSVGTVTSYLWDFGDGFFSTNRDPVYTYNTAGTYDVQLTVSGPCGMSSVIKSNYITVRSHPHHRGSDPVTE